MHDFITNNEAAVHLWTPKTNNNTFKVSDTLNMIVLDWALWNLHES